MSEENTFRMLQGEKPVQKIRCRFGWHRWTTWEVIEGVPSSYHMFPQTHAKCKCADCGFPREEYPYSKTRNKNAKLNHAIDKLKAKQKVEK